MKLTATLNQTEIDRALEEFVLRKTGGDSAQGRAVRLRYSPEAGQREPTTYSAEVDYLPAERSIPKHPFPRD